MSGLSITQGARLMLSTPPAMKISPSPAFTVCAAETTAWSPRPAEAVHRLTGDLDRKARAQEPHPRDIPVVLSRLVGTTEDHVVDRCRFDAGALQEGGDRVRGEVVWADWGEGTAVAPDRRPDGVDDDRSPGRAPVLTHRPRPTRSSSACTSRSRLPSPDHARTRSPCSPRRGMRGRSGCRC